MREIRESLCRRGTSAVSRAALVIIIVSIVAAIALGFLIWYLVRRHKANKARKANANSGQLDIEKSRDGISNTHSADIHYAPSLQYGPLEHADYQPPPESYQPQPPLLYHPSVIPGYSQAGSPRLGDAGRR
ncbi:uncharacterized protein CcaverHIS019_0206450 [Cutaneotrichosporon cavernicola]|uniref:Uncharacterized protein n=1 Tax=Cutaneotrichosporon cavernicola TaxID=279322 RepID=A0AA48III3_9TREE|nr:uncharacterized protein CcaverHIS019_0206450 [Cutaneotrichosporon cavernicola]BEI89283.1 hypothetical protein CcaverHIS019_0206450 [Cutaneotrichosporon cavernicola]